MRTDNNLTAADLGKSWNAGSLVPTTTAEQPTTVPWRELSAAVGSAKRYEQRTGKRCYVYCSKIQGGAYLTTTTMPLIGEWYDADGIRHG